MNSINIRLEQVKQQIIQACRTYNRDPDSVQLLAVSKTRPEADIQAALQAGQTCFGESYLQEALVKIEKLNSFELEWHYIGRIQSNKTRPIAEHFHWVHSIDKAKQARRLNEQRPEQLPALNVCLQIKIDDEASKGGLTPQEAQKLIEMREQLPNLRFRGLMTLPAPRETLDEQRKPFKALRDLMEQLNRETGATMDTLSMGMTSDLEAAIAEGATLVRVGTAIFGPRN